jgi:hypothetical protein
LPDLYKKIEDLVDKTALIKSLKEPEDKIGEPSPIRGNKFSHLSLEDFKETGDETFVWKSFEKKLSAYSFLKYLVQKNDIHVDLGLPADNEHRIHGPCHCGLQNS